MDRQQLTEKIFTKMNNTVTRKNLDAYRKLVEEACLRNVWEIVLEMSKTVADQELIEYARSNSSYSRLTPASCSQLPATNFAEFYSAKAWSSVYKFLLENNKQ